MRVNNETERVRYIYNQVADGYDPFMDLADKIFFGDGRSQTCKHARGNVLEIAIGTGRNLPHYPPDVQITGIDLSPAMLRVADDRAQQLGLEVALAVGDAQALSFPDASFDTVVATLALCSIPDDRQAITEMARILRPDGQLLLLEHVRSPILPVQVVQRLLNPVVVRLLADHILRDPLDHLMEHGFMLDHVERSALGIVERLAARKRAPTFA